MEEYIKELGNIFVQANGPESGKGIAVLDADVLTDHHLQ